MSEPQDSVFLGDARIDRAVGLVFELAAQLHVERQRRMGLEKLLRDKGVLDAQEMEALADDQAFLVDTRAELDA